MENSKLLSYTVCFYAEGREFYSRSFFHKNICEATRYADTLGRFFSRYINSREVSWQLTKI